MRRFSTQRPAAVPAFAAAVLLVSAGCTICPDPFDYSGPVPDGSAPQNDFRARAHGIVPLGSHPVPWPPVVRAEPGAGDDSRNVPVVAEAVVDETPADATDAVPAADPPADVTPAAAETAAAPVVVEPALEEILPPSPPRPEAAPRIRETPGWRPRG